MCSTPRPRAAGSVHRIGKVAERAEKLRENGLGMCLALSHKWFPSRAVDLDSMAEAVFLETDYWEKMQIAVANGIAKAFRGA